ncbi:PAS domain S-box protein [Mucilaginibacter corticis]|uniref:histidine kinase n=1 Tax=Mucilaginibacter corticis TaxID=2597670 RepID=A0A556M9C4_9SPHI|nr:HAMP domain-containing sensor histidine kinase [Mucilaginibacter corticis]TSJ36471.1 PAS domain S-box protein [Mucilaginibacter corticis]
MHTQFELYQLVEPLARLGIWERNLSTGECFWNSTVYELLEVGPEFTASQEEALHFYKESDRLRKVFRRVVDSGMPETTEAELITATGKSRWLKIRAAVRQQNHTSVLYGTLEDITDEVIVRHQLEEREERLAQAFRFASIGKALVSLNGRWLEVNPSLIRMLGYGAAELLDKTWPQLLVKEDLDTGRRMLAELLSGEIEYYSMEKRFRHASGILIWTLVNVSLVRNEGGKPLYFIAQIADISQQKKNSEIIDSQNKRLLNFANIVSHNLRTYSGNIQLLSRMIREEQEAAERDVLVEMLDKTSGTLLETLAHLNDVVTVQQLEVSRRNLNLLTEVQRVSDVLLPSLKAVGASLSVEIDPDVQVLFNPAYLESVLVNLISNSIKYRSPDRPLSVTVRSWRKRGLVMLNIADNGLGIDMAANGDKIFGLYNTFHQHIDARGVGLFMVKSQIETMGGSINVSSQVAEGTTFTIEFMPAERESGVVILTN